MYHIEKGGKYKYPSSHGRKIYDETIPHQDLGQVDQDQPSIGFQFVGKPHSRGSSLYAWIGST